MTQTVRWSASLSFLWLIYNNQILKWSKRKNVCFFNLFLMTICIKDFLYKWFLELEFMHFKHFYLKTLYKNTKYQNIWWTALKLLHIFARKKELLENKSICERFRAILVFLNEWTNFYSITNPLELQKHQINKNKNTRIRWCWQDVKNQKENKPSRMLTSFNISAGLLTDQHLPCIYTHTEARALTHATFLQSVCWDLRQIPGLAFQER